MGWTGRIVGFVLLITVVFTGEVPADSFPDWIHGESSRFSRERYLTGVGSGDTREAAEDGAYAALSRIFAAEISQRSREWEKYLQVDVGGKTILQRDISIDQLTTVSTKKVLENVFIAENYLDEKTQVHYALAVMDRRQAGSALRERITSLDLEVEELLKRARKTGHKLEKVRLLHRAIRTILLRDAYNTELRVVNPTGRGSEPLTHMGGIRQELQNFLTRNFRIRVEVNGKESDRIREAIVEGLNRHGLAVSLGDVAEVDVVIKGSVSFQPVEMPQAEFVRWTASFDLNDASTGQVIGSVNRHGREGHLTASEAQARALRAARRELSQEISSRLAAYIFGEGTQ